MCIAGAIVGAAVIGAAGSYAAASTQAGAQEQAAGTQQGMFNTIVGQEQPFMQAGYGATADLNYLLGIGNPGSGTPTGPSGIDPSSGFSIGPGGEIGQRAIVGQGGRMFAGGPGGDPAARMLTLGAPSAPTGGSGGLPFGYLTHQFSPQDFLNNVDPGYQFQLQTGQTAIRNADTPGSGALSGAALKDLMGFNQGMAATGYQNAFNRFTTQQNNIFDRLNQIAGLGQAAASNTGRAGATLGTGVAQAQAAAGGSLAGGIVGGTNSISNGLLLSSMLNANANNSWANNPANQNPGNWDTSGPGNFQDFAPVGVGVNPGG